jgi:hypothetical protein
VYEHILELGRERPDALLLDIGCCCTSDHDVLLTALNNLDSILVGVNARKAAADGFPAKNIIASDLRNAKTQFCE